METGVQIQIGFSLVTVKVLAQRPALGNGERLPGSAGMGLNEVGRDAPYGVRCTVECAVKCAALVAPRRFGLAALWPGGHGEHSNG
nr:hypothetical protein [uncultured Massilia sp.]